MPSLIQLEAESAKSPLSNYMWYQYQGPKSLKITASKGEVVLKKGDIYGIRSYTNTLDRIVLYSNLEVIFTITADKGSSILHKSSRYKGALELSEKPTKKRGPYKPRQKKDEPINTSEEQKE